MPYIGLRWSKHTWWRLCFCTQTIVKCEMSLLTVLKYHEHFLSVVCFSLAVRFNISRINTFNCIKRLVVITPLRRSDMARDHAFSRDAGFHSFTWIARVHPLMEWTILAFAFPAEAGTHLPTSEEWKAELAVGTWLVTYRNKCPAPGIDCLSVEDRSPASRIHRHTFYHQ